MTYRLDQLCQLPEKEKPQYGIYDDNERDTIVHNRALDACAAVEVSVNEEKLRNLIFEFYETECLDDAMNLPKLAQYIAACLPEILGKTP